jgi:phosphodiesterase/alkaline phosphatase D-like protein
MDNGDWIGPFLMRPSSISMGFWAYKDSSSLEEVKIIIEEDGQIIDELLMSCESIASSGIYQVGSKKKLKPNTKYNYFLKDELAATIYHSTFRTFPDFLNDENTAFNFFLMSCHGVEPYQKESPDGDAWHMWKELNATYDAEESNCYLAILSGDQVYMGDKFEGRIQNFKDKDVEIIKKDALEVYKKYWSNPEYRKFLSRIPAFLMWDDHDLIDGFGSRKEAFEKSGNLKSA